MRIFPSWLGALVMAVAVQAQDFTANLSEEERSAAGLDKLTPAELERLKTIVERYKAGEVAVVQQEAEQKVAEAEAKVREAETKVGDTKAGPGWLGALITLQRMEKSPATAEHLRSRLKGAFKSFSGRRSFALENGQVWQMVENDSYAGPAYEDPEVVIYPGLLGTYWLQIPQAAIRVKVRPLKLE